MTGFWKVLEDGGAVVLLFGLADGGIWLARHADRALAVLRRRGELKDRHREELRQLELKAKRRELEITHPELVKPICGCGHDLAFHNVESGRCHHPAESRDEAPSAIMLDVPHEVEAAGCGCQRYTGPEILGGVYLPPLSGAG